MVMQISEEVRQIMRLCNVSLSDAVALSLGGYKETCKGCSKDFITTDGVPWCRACRNQHSIRKRKTKDKWEAQARDMFAPYEAMYHSENEEERILGKLYYRLGQRYMAEKPWYLEPEDPLLYLGCDLKKFKKYIEKQFTEDMTWEAFMDKEKGRFFLLKTRVSLSSLLSKKVPHNLALKDFFKDQKKKRRYFGYKNFFPYLCKIGKDSKGHKYTLEGQREEKELRRKEREMNALAAMVEGKEKW